MRIETVTAKVFRHSSTIARDSDGHGHPGPAVPASSALFTITSDTGVQGHALTRAPDVDPAVLDRFVRPNLIGQDPLRADKLWYGIYKWQRLSGGLLTDRVLAMVDLALWDLIGKASGQPVWKLLGGHKDKVPAYASTMCGDDLPGGLATPDDYARYAEWLVQRGYKAIKLHGWMPPMPGAPDVRKDAAACAAVREAVGPDIRLMLDPHHFYSRSDALWLGQRLEALDFLWMEEPMEEASMSSYQWLSSNLTRLNILGPETAAGKHWTRGEWVRNGACDMVRTGVWDVGGINPSLKIAHMAECFHISCEVHGTGAGNLAVAAGVPNCTYYERGLLHPFLDYEAPKEYQLRIDDEMDSDGYVNLRDMPGLGQDLDFDYIDANLI